MAKKQQPKQKRPSAASQAASDVADGSGPSTAAAASASKAKGGSKAQQPKQPPYLALLNGTEGGDEQEGGMVGRALEALDALAEEPEAFVAPPPELAQALTRVLKAVFDHARSTQPIKLGPLQELLVEGFDTETLWEQLQLRNPAVTKFVQRVIRRLEEQGDGLAVLEEASEEGDDEEEGSEEGSLEEGEEGSLEESGEDEDARFEELVGDESGSDEEAQEEEEGSEMEEDEAEEEEVEEDAPMAKPSKAKAGKKGKGKQPAAAADEGSEEEEGGAGPTTKLNDGFFDWDEMERFADEAEQEEFGDDDEDEEDEEDDEEEDDEDVEVGDGMKDGREIRYKDFFGDEAEGEEEEEEGEEPFGHEEGEEEEQEEKEGQEGEEAGEEESEVDESQLTAYERMKRAKRKEIEALEEELVAERPWELRGEVNASDRPENSLLEAVVDVERARRPEPLEAPAETSQSLEEMIKQRILEERFDDVVPREVSEEVLLNKRDRRDELPEVSQEKSQQGLGEVYEQEYLRLALGVEGESAEAKAKAEMAALFRKLCTKLDALSNFHFTPKAANVDVSVKPNVPAIAMEEVLPLAVSTGDTQAPEEVHEKKTGREGVLRDPAELAQEERKRIRQGKKAARRKARRQKQAEEKLVARLNPGLGNKYAREKVRAEIRESGKVVQGKREEGPGKVAYSTSAKFFAGLQEEVTKHGGAYAKKKARAGEEKEGRLGAANALKL